MMIQVFSRHLQLAQAGKLDFLACPLHNTEEVYPLQHHLDKNDKIFLYCPACGYKNVVGQTLYENVIKMIAPFNEPEKMEHYE